jgi:hypothetical protein
MATGPNPGWQHQVALRRPVFAFQEMTGFAGTNSDPKRHIPAFLDAADDRLIR